MHDQHALVDDAELFQPLDLGAMPVRATLESWVE